MRTHGIVFGSFQPFHKGHLSLVLRAKHECDDVYVFCCGFNGDIRDSYYDLPLEKRYRLVKKYFENDNLVNVDYINDSEIGAAENQFTEEGWKIWLTAIKHRMPINYNNEDYEHYVWYVGEERYVEPLKKFDEDYRNKIVLVDRDEFPISGTQIRENPIKYWDYIADTFRGEFSTNILVTGTASEGKTNLVQDAAKFYNLPYSTEMAREVLRKNGKIGFDKQITGKDFIDFLVTQYHRNKDLIESKENNKGIFIADSDNLVTLMYAKAYSEMGYNVTKEEYEKILYPLAKRLCKGTKWDLILLTPPESSFKDDGERNRDQASLSERKKNYSILKRLIKNIYPNTTVKELKGSYKDKYNLLSEEIEWRLSLKDCK